MKYVLIGDAGKSGYSVLFLNRSHEEYGWADKLILHAFQAYVDSYKTVDEKADGFRDGTELNIQVLEVWQIIRLFVKSWGKLFQKQEQWFLLLLLCQAEEDPIPEVFKDPIAKRISFNNFDSIVCPFGIPICIRTVEGI